MVGGGDGEEKVIGREMVVQGRFWRGGCRRESNGEVNGRQSREVLPRLLRFQFNGCGTSGWGFNTNREILGRLVGKWVYVTLKPRKRIVSVALQWLPCEC